MGANKAAELGNITTLDIYSNYKEEKTQFLGGVIECYIYESILDNTVRSTIVLADTGTRFNKGEDAVSALNKGDIQLTAGEKVDLVLTDGLNQTLKFMDDYHFRIREVSNIIQDTKKTFFSIDLYSKECIDNELISTRLSKRYDGKISDSVNSILKTPGDGLVTPKTVDIDTTLNHFNFLGNVEKPFHKLVWLAKRSVPDLPNALGNLAGYFFYEVADDGTHKGGYKFKSIDKLFQEKYKRKLVFTNNQSLPTGYDAKILSYDFNNTVDLESQLLTGSLFNTKIKTFDFTSHEYKENLFSSSKQFNESTNGGLEPIKVGNDLNLQDAATKTFYKSIDKGILPSGSTDMQLKKSKEINFDVDGIMRQSAMRYNNLFTTKLVITIPGDFGLHAGDVIHCDFPEVSGKENKEISYRLSGLYMIVDLCHFVQGRPVRAFTKLNLVRESIGRKPF